MANLQTSNINISSSGDNTVIAGVAGEIIQIMSLYIRVSILSNVELKDGASTIMAGPMNTLAGQYIYLPMNPNNTPLFQTSAGNAFIINLSGVTPQAGGFVTFYQL